MQPTVSKVKQQAQSQAMKLLLLNNISNIIRGSVDTSKILNSALDELSQLFAAFRAYYAVYSKDMQAYIINESLHKKDISRKIRSTVQNKSKNATWITNVPYGYVMKDYQKRIYEVDMFAAPIIQRIYD